LGKAYTYLSCILMFRALEIGKTDYKSVPHALRGNGQVPEADLTLDPALSSPLAAPPAASPCATPKPGFLRTSYERACSPLARRPSPSPSPMSRGGRTQHFTLNLKPRTLGTTQKKPAKSTSASGTSLSKEVSKEATKERYAGEETILGRVPRAVPPSPREKLAEWLRSPTERSRTPRVPTTVKEPEDDSNLLSPAGRQTGAMTKKENFMLVLRNVGGAVRSLNPKGEKKGGDTLKEKRSFGIKNIFSKTIEAPEENTLLAAR